MADRGRKYDSNNANQSFHNSRPSFPKGAGKFVNPPKCPYQSRRLRSESKIVGYHSVDGYRNYLNDSSKLLYHNPPNFDEVVMDLDEGREKAVCRKETFKSEGIQLLLRWIMENRKIVKAPADSDRLIKPDFVCSRGLLIKLLMAPYNEKELWRIIAGKWRGTIYLQSDKEVDLFPIDEEANKKFTSWGHKFEQYILSEKPDQAPDTTKPVIEPEEFRCIYQTLLGEYSVLFSTVVKGVCSKELLKDPLPLHKLKFVDLKTSRVPVHPNHERTLKRFKFLKWWLMNYLTNTEKILCGFRDDNGVIQRLTHYTLDQLVAMSSQYWDPQECLKSCETFLKKLVETVVEEHEETIYEFTRVSHEDFKIVELKPSEKDFILTQSYIDAMG